VSFKQHFSCPKDVKLLTTQSGNDIPVLSITGFGSTFQGLDEMQCINMEEGTFFLFANDPPYPSQFDHGVARGNWSPLTRNMYTYFRKATYFARLQVRCPAQVLTQALLTSVYEFDEVLRLSEYTFLWAWSTVLVFGTDCSKVKQAVVKISTALDLKNLVVEQSHRTKLEATSLQNCGLKFEQGSTDEGWIQYTVQDMLPLEALR